MAWKPDYLTAEEAGEFVRLPGGSPADEAELATWCTAASRAIDTKTNRQFGKVDVLTARTYRRPAAFDVVSGLWLLEVDDVQDVTGLTVGGTAYADAGVTLLPDNAAADGRPFERIGFGDYPTGPVVVTALWGWSAVPAQVVGACKLQVSRWAARRDSPFGVAGSPSDGSELRLLARLDPDVSTTLAGLSRRRRVG
ncbi:hypothetical protein AB0K20_23310 [Micromonospora matsumotoense]|uniref:hypothetical protein n=1 Tax=Micromonospora matsumotoense TaxID=121616 RepID=UPI00341449BC